MSSEKFYSENDHCELDNILVKQKDYILKDINKARTQEDINRCLFALNTVRELWERCNYKYKYMELYNRALQENERICDERAAIAKSKRQHGLNQLARAIHRKDLPG